MSTDTANLGLTKYDDDETGWSAGGRANLDTLDLLYQASAGDPGGAVTGKVNQIYRNTDDDTIWMCLVGGTNNNWINVGELVKASILNVRNVWEINQAMKWKEITALGVMGTFSPTSSDSWVHIKLDSSIVVDLPTGIGVTEAQLFVFEFETVTDAAIGISFNAGYNWTLDLVPEALANGDSFKMIAYYSPALGGTWRADFQLLDVA